jgi:Saxitoxin biosynthesis operon protein SxtJ
MNIRDDIKQLKLGDRDLRKFGLMVGGVFAVLGILMLLRHKAHAPYFLWPGAVLFVLGAAQPRTLKWVYVGWMSVAFVLGFIMAHIILTLFFFIIITPIGLAARMFGQDFLSLKLNRNAPSYWIPRPQKARSAAEYERQF